jgi:hypothetical protein
MCTVLDADSLIAPEGFGNHVVTIRIQHHCVSSVAFKHPRSSSMCP